MKFNSFFQQAKMLVVLLNALILTACVAIEDVEPISISGSVSFGKRVELPEDAIVTVALVDLNHPGRVFEKQNYAANPEAVFFQFILAPKEVVEDAKYGLVAVAVHQDNILYQTYGRYEVLHNERYVHQLILKKL